MVILNYLFCVFIVATAATESQNDSEYRLPTTVKPIHYEFTLFPNIYTNNTSDFKVQGEVMITINCTEATDKIILHASSEIVMSISNYTITTLHPQQIHAHPCHRILDHSFDTNKEFLNLTLNKNMGVGQFYNLTLRFEYPIKKDNKGIYYGSYEHGDKKIYLVTSSFQPSQARRAFPCFDEPAMKATFTVHIYRKQNYSALSVMPVEHTSMPRLKNDVMVVKDTFKKTPPMSTYYLAVTVADFRFISHNNGTPVRVFAKPSLSDQLGFALDLAVKGLTFFEQYFETPYPLPKIDHVAVPEREGSALENWGLPIYKEEYLIYVPNVTAYSQKKDIAKTIYHELAHMWFGNLVTPAWWDDIWLNEGFATYMSYLALDSIHPDWKKMDLFVIETIHKAFSTDAVMSSHPIFKSIITPVDVKGAFDSGIYTKSASLIHMMRNVLGYQTFKKAIARFLQTNKFTAVTHDALWDAFTQQASDDDKPIPVSVKEIMDPWLKQNNFPVVTVTRDPVNNQIQVKQKRFLENPSAVDPKNNTSVYGYQWTIPVTLTSSENPDFDQEARDIYWIYHNQTNKTFNVRQGNLPSPDNPNGWILANTKLNGFYRVNYDNANWNNLIKQLNTDHTAFPMANRAQIINDAWNLVKSGNLNLSKALGTLNYLNKERSIVPWKTAVEELHNVGNQIKSTNASELFKSYMQEKITPSFNRRKFNFTGSSDESDAAEYFAKLACYYDHEGCQNEALRQFRQWMNNSANNPINPNFRQLFYCKAVEQGGQSEWNFAKRMFNEAQVPSEKKNLFHALSCSKTPSLLTEYLGMYPLSRVHILYAIVYASYRNESLAWRFYKDNFDDLSTELSNDPFMWARTITLLTQNFNTDHWLNEVKTLMESKTTKLGVAVDAFNQALERIRNNIKWMNNNYGTVFTYLSQNLSK